MSIEMCAMSDGPAAHVSVAPPAVKLILRGTITMRRPVSTTLAASPRLPGTRPEEFGNTRAVSESTGFVT